MLKILRALTAIPDIKCSLYADDIAIWTNTGNPGQIQDNLQSALNVVEESAKGIGLECSTEKTELLLVHNQRWKPPSVRLVHQGKLIEPQPSIKILGLHIQQDEGGRKAVNHILKQGERTLHMMRRVGNKNWGLKEADLLKLRDALNTTRIEYQIPCVNLTNELLKIDFIRSSVNPRN